MSLLLRLNKAAPLTNAEVDNNFLYLEGLITGIQNSKLNTANLATQLQLIDGVGSGIDADKLDDMQPTDQNVNMSIVSRNASGDFSAHVITASLVGNASSATVAAGFSGVIPFANGGTGATSLTTGYVKSNGSILLTTSTVSGSDVSGNISGNATNVTGVVSIANGGTGATTATDVRTALALIPNQTIQAYSSNLQDLSNLSSYGFVARGAIMHVRNIEIGNGLHINNPDGVAGNPKIELTIVPIENGGTGSNTAPGALASLGAAPIVNASLQGIPTAPTASFGTKTSQIATTEFVVNNRVPSGTLLIMTHLDAPSGFLLTDGTAYNIVNYPDLYAVIGTRFGVSGGGTFRVPSAIAPAGFISVIKI